MMDTVALAPAVEAGREPVTSMTTGKEDTPVDVVASSLTEPDRPEDGGGGARRR